LSKGKSEREFCPEWQCRGGAIASEREQFYQGSREMFGQQKAEPPKELESSGNHILNSVFRDTQTLFVAELE
jgi:hypothetical protein